MPPDEAEDVNPPPVFSPDVQRGIALILAQVSEAATEARRAREASEHASRDVVRLALGHDVLTKSVAVLSQDVVVLKREVFGSNPPPAAPTPPAPVVVRVSQTEAEHDALRGVVLAMDARLSNVESLNQKQSEAMGIDKTGRDFLGTDAGRAFVLRMVTLLAASLGTIATIISLLRGAPPPASPAPAIHGEVTR
jgi:hypothetical protein